MVGRVQFRRLLIIIALPSAAALFFSGCGTTGTRALPPYEAPLTKADFQDVRTTAYTHTEADHLEYSNHNALGGELHAAGPPIRRAENRRFVLALEDQNDYRRASYSGGPQPFSMDDNPPPAPRRIARAQPVAVKTVRGRRIVVS